MERTTNLIRRTMAGVLLLFALSTSVWAAANTKKTVEKVSGTVTLNEDVDYIVTSTSPFASDGVVDIANTEHAVLILSAVKPSKAIPMLAAHVTINGEKAVNNTNCQVKLYNRGAIIMPYGSDFKPLTVFSEQNFEGESVNSFGLENTGGFMNTLSAAKLNNRIRSFKLKRGYMVTFANRSGGRGYSRCFIAADQDLEVPVLPGILDRSISSYRVFQWFDCGKVALAAAAGDNGACSALNVTSTYTWSTGSSMAPDVEVVPHQIYSGQPSDSSVGSATFSPHMKTSNEPRNSADDHPEDLAAILNNWESLMRTGMRLCTPSSWDGSDYWNGTGFLKEFLDSIDARGWRCDIVDMHCYWAEGSFPNLNNWHIGNRPIWISEWCWGASWNSNGAFASGVTENNVRDALQRICNSLNGMAYVERYFYWNSERDPSKLYKGNSLTPAGNMYAQLDGGVGYNGKYNYVPKVPAQKDPANLTVNFDKETNAATLTWNEYNGDNNVSMTVQRKRGTDNFEDIVEIEMKDLAAEYTYEDKEAQSGDVYRISIEDGNNQIRYSRTMTALSDNLEPGDPIDVDGTVKYLGGNMIANGDFDYGFTGWTDIEGNTIAAPYFQVVPVGSKDGGSYLQSYGNGTVSSKTQIIRTAFDVESNEDYYFSGTFANGYSVGQQVVLNNDGTTVSTSGGSAKLVFSNSAVTNTWETKAVTFNTESFTKALISYGSLQHKFQCDKQMLCKLFESREAAIADGVEKAKLRVQAFQDFNRQNAVINSELAQQVGNVSGTDEQSLAQLNELLDTALKAYNRLAVIDSLVTVCGKLADLKLAGYAELAEAASQAKAAGSIADIISAEGTLREAIAQYMTFYTAPTANQPKNGRFSTGETSWTVKCGTYTGGDQRVNTTLGTTFWNAWWSNVSAAEGSGKTMEIKQEVKGLPHGFYSLQCSAMTEHFCVSDQHAYIVSGDVTAESPVLSADYLDLAVTLNMPAVNVWQTLTTTPVYVDEGGSVTVGFKSSKQGAEDNMWSQVAASSSATKGDNREGWWGATNFVLNYSPSYKSATTPGVYGAIVLPYAIKPAEGLHLYKIVGITADKRNVCLEEIFENRDGEPVVYKSENTTSLFCGYGESRKVVRTGEAGTFGTFTASSCPKGWFYPKDGAWQLAESSTPVPAFTAFIKGDNLLVVKENWDGETMPIHGIAPDDSDGILLPGVNGQSVRADGLYTIDGRAADNGSQMSKGLYIRVENGQSKKLVVK